MRSHPHPEGPSAPAAGTGIVMLRLTGEISTKARRTRARFQRVLVRNLHEACGSAGWTSEIRDEWSRLFLHTDGLDGGPLTRVFGIGSFSRLDAECRATLGEIVEVGQRLYAERVRGRTFAVRARRVGTHDFRSQQVMARLGAALDRDARVDLTDPQVEVFVEVRGERALFFSERTPGAGGLPLGVEGRAVALVSGGFDSAVAAWMMLRRGVALDYVFCNLGGGAYKRLVLEVIKVLADRWSYGTEPRIHIIDFGSVVDELRRCYRPSLHQLALKRQMYRAANLIAETLGADAIVTGEAVGQVSSQTLPNLRAIDDASRLPVLRPLVGVDKEDIIRSARRIGTYALSARVREYCALGSGRPATAASPEVVRRDDEKLDPTVVARATGDAEVLGLRGLDLAEVASDAVFWTSIPSDSVVIDTREREAYARWHWPGALHREAHELEASFRDLERGARYVLYCAEGLKSARLAERMQAAGYEAYSFLGGERPLMRLSGAATTESSGTRSVEP